MPGTLLESGKPELFLDREGFCLLQSSGTFKRSYTLYKSFLFLGQILYSDLE